MNDIVSDIVKIKEAIPGFLEHQCNKEENGYYSYSYTGDIYGSNVHWNVPGSVFAADIAYVIKDVGNPKIGMALKYLKSFQKNNGYIYSDLIRKKGFCSHLLGQMKSRKITDISNADYVRAETRQVLRTLNAYNSLPDNIPQNEIIKGKEVLGYLHSLNWNKPWAAGSHFSHKLFFLKIAYINGIISEDSYKAETRKFVDFIDEMWKPIGAWGANSGVTLQQFINGAMKILTGLELLDWYHLPEDKAEQLTDLCLKSLNDTQACDNYNIIYILKCTKKILGDYREKEINAYAERKFRKYLEFYYPQYGGFSFLPGHANNNYYGFHISKGKNEPDIHGTRMFVWGIDLIAQILGIEDEVGLQQMKE